MRVAGKGVWGSVGGGGEAAAPRRAWCLGAEVRAPTVEVGGAPVGEATRDGGGGDVAVAGVPAAWSMWRACVMWWQRYGRQRRGCRGAV